MTIIPDTKDWTWVLERPCPQCGFDAARVLPTEVAHLIRANAAEWPAALERPSSGDRPDESTWSTLEYGAHVRDVLRLYRSRLRLMLDEHDPLFANWDQDAAAVADRYAEQDPAVVASELTAAAEELALAFEAVTDAEWSRPGRRSDGAVFTVASFSLYFVHDVEHHLWDVSRE